MTASPRTPVLAHIAFGANLGDRRANIERALAMLDALDGARVTARSTLHETTAVTQPSDGASSVGSATAGAAGPSQPDYLNAAAAIETTLPPRALLNAMLEIERAIGRDRAREGRWGARVIDLDLLLYGDAVIDEPGLRVPHPRMASRRFVLAPLAEIAPEAGRAPLGRSVASLLRALGG